MSNFKEDVVFNKSIIISTTESSDQTGYGSAGQLRFNQSTLKFEGYHSYPNSNAGADIFGNNWRTLTQDVASTSKLGIIRVGSNLNMQASTGILSSVAAGVSRIYQCVITVSPIDGAADYQSINEAISHAIGSPSDVPPYTYGFLTSNIGGTGIASPPSPLYPFVIQLGPGQYSESSNQIILPDYVSLRGEDNYNSVIIVEGSVDCMFVHQAGFPNVVATLGAAVSKKQGDMIRRFFDKITLFCDNDEAGMAMRYAMIEMCRGKEISVARIPEGVKDPAEMTKEQIVEAINNKEIII